MNVHIAFICETWCKPDIIADAELSLNDDFTVFRQDRPGTKPGGGVCLLVHRLLKCARVELVCTSEICAVDLFLPRHTLRLISAYYPPWRESSDLGISRIISLTDDLDRLLQTNHLIICCGDFNLPDICWTDRSSPSSLHDALSKEEIFLEFLSAFGLTQLVSSPTHRSGNILDLVLTNDIDLITQLDISAAPILSDHSCILFRVLLPLDADAVRSPRLDFPNAD